ncbi:methyl-accepting chemotaxis protein [Mobiluncus curtisii]|uniref:methyl-accepting chemotaxis protein n=1 Tax=Mobiluncus curtisii TaxID=2051 RepID=UPI0020168985|nr:methyl-accepting chemotaxis protein [Mobiluncus curtisii]
MKLSSLVKISYALISLFAVLAIFATIFSQVQFGTMRTHIGNKANQTAQAARVSTASANLTNYVQEYVVTTDSKWLEKYWKEVAANNKADAVAQLEKLGAPASETDLVKQGMAKSDKLVDLETRAQRLILDSQGIEPSQMPPAVAQWPVNPEDATLTPTEKQDLARELIFGDQYNDEVEKIMTPIQKGVNHMNQRLDISARDSANGAGVALWILSVVAIALVISVVVLLVMFNQTTARPIQEFRKSLDSHDAKDLTMRLRALGVQETQQLAQTINAKNSSIAELISVIATSAHNLELHTSEIDDTTHQMNSEARKAAQEANKTANNANEVSAAISTVAAASEEMGASIREISSNATNAAEVANHAMDVASYTTEIMAKLSDSSQRIGEVIASITQIAEQTNLLALNATIEAARAGDAGKGFAVVAGEVKDLASQTGTATSDISARVLSIQEDTANAEQALQQITEVINQINESQTVIAAAVEEQTATVNEISHSVQSAAEGSAEIASDIEMIAGAATSNSEELEKVSATMQTVLSISTDLAESVSGFKVDNIPTATANESPAEP